MCGGQLLCYSGTCTYMCLNVLLILKPTRRRIFNELLVKKSASVLAEMLSRALLLFFVLSLLYFTVISKLILNVSVSE